ncbi:MAG: CCA tRNA nucleotidyltransferase [Intestinibacillus sp.]
MNGLSLPAPAALALAQLEAAGFAAYLVGGCVRDSLRGVPPHDWDLCTAARPEQVRAALGADFSVLDTGLQHGTVTAVREHVHLEITTFRTEGAYSDGRRPDGVSFAGRVEDDLSRRDFTVNAMAWSPARGLVDPFGGRDDLEAGLLRCVGDPDARFTEDALRIARALRFASETGFAVEIHTAAAMLRQMGLLDRIARERLCEELRRTLCGRYVGRVLRAFPDVLAQFCPELRPMFGFAQHNAHHLYDVWEHTVRVVEAVPDGVQLRLAALLHDSGKPASFTMDERGVGHFYGHPKISALLAHKLLVRLRFDHETRAAVVRLVEYHDRRLDLDPARMRRRLHALGEARVRQLLVLKKADCVGRGTHREYIAELCRAEAMLNDMLAQNQCFSLRQLAVNGRDMMALGLHGPQIGDMLHALLAHVLEHPADNQKERLLALARQMRDDDEDTGHETDLS